jgi:hypothetical protein
MNTDVSRNNPGIVDGHLSENVLPESRIPEVPDGYLPLDSELEAVLTRVLRPVYPGARIIGWVPTIRSRTGDGPLSGYCG